MQAVLVLVLVLVGKARRDKFKIWIKLIWLWGVPKYKQAAQILTRTTPASTQAIPIFIRERPASHIRRIPEANWFVHF